METSMLASFNQDFEQLLKVPSYKKFQSKLIVSSTPILGIKVPVLKSFVKNYINQYGKDVLCLISLLPVHESLEKDLVKGLLITYSYKICKLDLAYTLNFLDGYVSSIDNWEVCDVIASSFMCPKKYKEEMKKHCRNYVLNSDIEFVARFYLILLIHLYRTSDDLVFFFDLLSKIHNSSYYVQMGMAWVIQILSTISFEQTYNFIKNSNIEYNVKKMAIRKICDSFQITDDNKAKIKEMI